MKTQLAIDEAMPPPTKTNNKTTRKRHDTVEQPLFTYHVPCQKGKPTLAPVTQDEPELQSTTAATTKNAAWKLDGRMYGKTNINPPLAGILREALSQFMGKVFFEATPIALEEVANGVVYPVTKETITKYKKLIEDPL